MWVDEPRLIEQPVDEKAGHDVRICVGPDKAEVYRPLDELLDRKASFDHLADNAVLAVRKQLLELPRHNDERLAIFDVSVEKLLEEDLQANDELLLRSRVRRKYRLCMFELQ